MPRLIYIFALLCVLALPASAPLLAQETVNNASLSGRVTDVTGATIPNAAIAATQLTTNLTRTTQTSTAGTFKFPYLPVGTYTLTVTQPGFATATRTLHLTVGAAFDLPIILTLAATTTVLQIDEFAPPLLETNRSQIAATISSNEVTALPFNGRNFLDLALLAPGVSPTNTAANQLFAETSAVPGQGLSVNSQRNFSNAFILDGLSANDDASGLVQTSFGLDVIQELQVVTSGGQAEFGRALGGYLNFVSRSGSNRLHGDVYAYLRDKNLNAQNAFSHTQLPYTQLQSGASLSGPIVHDRTFYFANFEQRQLNQTNSIAITAANAAAIDTVLTNTAYPGQQLSIAPTGITIYPNPVRSSNFFAKLDHHLNQRDDLSLRYSLYHVTSRNSRGAGGLSYTSAAAGLDDLDQTIALSNILTLTPRTANETRAQFTNSNFTAPVNDPIGPAVSISGVATFGTLSGSPTARYDRLYEVVDNLSHQAGPHSLRLGADLLYNDLTITFPQSIRGSYAFSSLANFQRGVYSTFTQSFGNYVVPQTNPNLGLYAQDEWHVSPSLTLNLGLRYDLQFLQAVSTDTNNLSPRIGFAWSPYASRSTVVRGSFGLFYDRVPLRALSNALESNGNSTTLSPNTFTTLALNYGQSGAPVFPAIATGYTATTLPPNLRISLTTMDPHLQNAASEQTSLEIDQQLTPTSSLALSYQHLRGLHLIVSVNKNTPTCTSATDPINLCRPNSAYANNKQYDSAADSTFDGLELSYVQRPVRFGSVRLSYTWSKALDNVSEFFFSSPLNNFNLREDRSRSDDDQRHRLSFDATLHTKMKLTRFEGDGQRSSSSLHRQTTRFEGDGLQPVHSPSNSKGALAPEGADGPPRFSHLLTDNFQLSTILQYYSALPFNITTGGNTLQTTAQRPCAPGYTLVAVATNPCYNAVPGSVIGRNAGTGFNSFTLNARLTRTFPLGERLRLETIAEAFNALNHRNDLFPNATFGTGTYPTNPSPTFGTPTNAADPRAIQLAARLTF